MTLGLVFWILMLLWLVFGAWGYRAGVGDWVPVGGNLLLFILLVILGWKNFGPPIHG